MVQTIRIEVEYLGARASLMAALGKRDLGKAQAELSGTRTAIKRLEQERRAMLGAHAQLARLWPAELPGRSAADILAGVIRGVLGDRTVPFVFGYRVRLGVTPA